MKTFERQFKDLPWAEPGENLRQRVMADIKPGLLFRMHWFSMHTLGRAALWIVSGMAIGYGLGRFQGGPVASAPSPGEVIVVQTGTEHSIFNQTGEFVEAIPGEWTLDIEPEGGSQG